MNIIPKLSIVATLSVALGRGFAVVRASTGEFVTSAAAAGAAPRLQVQFMMARSSPPLPAAASTIPDCVETKRQNMTFQESILECFRKYVDFDGDADRPEFWWFVLFLVVVGLVLSLIWRPLAGLFGLITLLPSLAVGTRRLHDTNHSGWWIWLCVLGPIGWVVLAFFAVQEGDLSTLNGRSQED